MSPWKIFEKYSGKLNHPSVLADNGQCVLWIDTLKQFKNINYGVICRKFGSVWKTVYIHRLKFILENKIADLDPGVDISHTCHISLCMRKDHFSSEPHTVNTNLTEEQVSLQWTLAIKLMYYKFNIMNFKNYHI